MIMIMIMKSEVACGSGYICVPSSVPCVHWTAGPMVLCFNNTPRKRRMAVIDWRHRFRQSASQLENDLNGLGKPVSARIDLRCNDLPLSCLDCLVRCLRHDKSVSICVGNNSFDFAAFYKELQQMDAVALFETNRITLGWTSQDIEVGRLAAAALKEDRVLQLSEAMAAMQKEHSAAYSREQTLRSRVLTLEGYNSNQDKSLEHAVTDEVDDFMQD